MSFKKKLVIAFSIVIILPVILFLVAFFVVGNILFHQTGDGTIQSYSAFWTDQQTATQEMDSLYNEISDRLASDPTALEDTAYLDSLKQELNDRTFLIVRKGNAVYYTTNQRQTDKIFDKLPGYAEVTADSGEGYYIGHLDCIVKQLDFTFSDGSEGSLFIVATFMTLIPRVFLIGMLIALILVMAITGILLTNWIRRSVLHPVDELNKAMKQIRDGNLEYMLPVNQKGEIGELYQNYEDMRLRLKESADEKLENDKHDRELVSNIAHDLKTPITSIKGYAEGLIDGVANTPEKQEKYLRTILNKANDMNRLINELTLYAKIDNNKIPYNFQRINVKDYFGDCVEEIGMDMESRGIQLNYFNLVSPDTLIIADPEQLKRVINNIISNSVKYMDKPKGRIDIRILDEQDSVRVEIEDNGKGIAQRDLPNIFDRFYRTDSSRNSAQGGSGIGLSIVKKIIEDHGGYIWATSHEGEGTCMHFVLRKYREMEPKAEGGNTTVDSKAGT